MARRLDVFAFFLALLGTVLFGGAYVVLRMFSGDFHLIPLGLTVITLIAAAAVGSIADDIRKAEEAARAAATEAFLEYMNGEGI